MANVRECGASNTLQNSTLVTTAETVIATSPAIDAPSDSFTAVVIAWAQLTTGTNTTAVTPRIRRGTTASGTLVMLATAEQVKAAAGSTEPFIIMVTEDRTTPLDFVQYTFTLQQTAASANGTAVQCSILVMLI